MTTAAICAPREVSWQLSFYRGEQYDSDLGLYYLRARYYNPATGRFLSRDPEDGDSNNPASLHKYLYANGDPVNGWDPTGRGDQVEYIDLNATSAVTKFMVKKLACGVVGILFKVAMTELGITGWPAAYGSWGAGVICSALTPGSLGSGN